MNTREIKFRLWNPNTKDMIYRIRLGVWQGSDENMMQYTGLKDKNGQDVFEGDVVTFKPNLGVTEHMIIEWGNDEMGFGMKSKDGFLYGVYDGNLGEVIGDIYSNPDLLK